MRGLYGFDFDLHELHIDLVMQDGLPPETLKLPVLPPHQVLRAVATAGAPHWSNSILGPMGDNALSRYWELQLRQSWGQKHPHLDGDLKRKIPIVWHVDGADVFSNSEFVIWSWASATSHADSLESKFLLCMVPWEYMQTKAQKRAVYVAVCAYIKWEMEVLNTGKIPEFDFHGRPLARGGESIASGYTAAFAAIKADAKARVEMRRWLGKQKPRRTSKVRRCAQVPMCTPSRLC